MNKGVYIEFSDERTGQKQVFAYEGGLKDFAIYLNENKTPLYKDPVYISGESKLVKLELAMQHTDTYTENMFSYVNNIPTTEGGTHETGFKSALTRLMNELAREQGWLKEKEQNLLAKILEKELQQFFQLK